MNSESGREIARQMNSESGREALDLIRRGEALGLIQRESEPEARASEPDSGQARRAGHERKATNSRRKEKRRRRANSLSLRRSG